MGKWAVRCFGGGLYNLDCKVSAYIRETPKAHKTITMMVAATRRLAIILFVTTQLQSWIIATSIERNTTNQNHDLVSLGIAPTQ